MFAQVPKMIMKKSMFNCMQNATWNLLSDAMSAEIVSLSMGEATCTFAHASLPRA